MSRTRSILAATAALTCVCALAACGEKKETLGPAHHTPLSLVLDFFPNADHAGIYAAQANGDFRQAGLDVAIHQPTDPAAPLKQVAAGRADLAVSYEPELLRARDKGLHVVAIGALVRSPLTSIISLPAAKVRAPKNLKGKTVGTAGIDYQTAYLHTILLDAGVNPETVKERNVGFGLNPALLTHKVDATLGGFWNYEGIELKLKHKHPRIIKIEDAGVPTYNELVLVANEDAIKRDATKLRSFVAALARGTQQLKSDPEKNIEGLLKANPDLDPKLQRASVKATLPLFLPVSGQPFGWQDPGQWQAFTAWMRDNKLLTTIPDASGAFTNGLLPGRGL
jgi:putative hydroxymethylpyrimidine transport system substrate-binding protein